MNDPIAILTERRDALAKRVEKARAQLAQQERELEEIDIALRVLQVHVIGAEEPKLKTQASGLADQVLLVVDACAPAEGMMPKDVLKGLKEHFSITPTAENVRTTLWRLHRDKKLIKTGGGGYVMPQTDTGSEPSSEPVGEEEEAAETTKVESAKPTPVVSMPPSSSLRRELLSATTGVPTISTPNPNWQRRK